MNGYSSIEIRGAMRRGVLLSRKKKFLGEVLLAKKSILAFVPHTGRLDGILEEKSKVIIVARPAETRRLGHDLIAADVDGIWVVVDTRLANELVAANLAAGKLRHLGDFGAYEREKTIEGFRFDFILHNGRTQILEVKSCTRAVNGAATFPDTVSVRSTRQVEKMITLVRRGYRCSVLFVAMRPDVQRFKPDWDRDPIFAQALRKACKKGVEVAAISTVLKPPSFRIVKRIAAEID